MNAVMLDNWTLNTAFLQLLDDTEDFSEDMFKLCMGNVLIGIILWDKLCSTPDKLTETRYNLLQDHNTLTYRLLTLYEPVNIPESSGFKSGVPSVRGFIEDKQNFHLMSIDRSASFIKRTEMYLDLSSRLNINYFPHPNRSMHIYEQNLLRKRFDRYKLLEIVDKTIIDYYEGLTEAGSSLLVFSYPVLYDYIRREANSPMDELRVALDLRNDKNVLELRQGLNRLDEALNKGSDRPFIIAVQKQINELSNEIANKYAKKKKVEISTIKVGLSLPFNIGFDLEIPANKQPALGWFNRSKKILNLTFLSRLLDFGLGRS